MVIVLRIVHVHKSTVWSSCLQDPYYMRRRRYAYGYQGNVMQQPEPKMNFFQAIFSFVFGDGDPNLDWEERRWQTVSGHVKCVPPMHKVAEVYLNSRGSVPALGVASC
jgi:hypothetical protein